jgi:EAL domain-containing protein (putative c-di-GMP-specific phosphodiesterase class I)/integral membrane sensor domain MASE1
MHGILWHRRTGSCLQASLALRRLPYLAQIGLVALAYFAAAHLSLALAIPPGYAAAVWPPSGIAVAAVLLAGSRVWPAIWLGSALANIGVEASLLPAVVFASGNTLEALVAAQLIRRYVGDPGRFERAEDVFKFVAACAWSAAIAATVALLPLAAGYRLEAGGTLRNWWTWWQGDLSGMLLVVPLVLGWSAPGEEWSRRKTAEAAWFALLLLLAATAIASDEMSRLTPFSLTFVALPFILWAAFRFGQREVASAIAVTCGIAVWYTVQRREIFGALALNELLLLLLTFIGIVVVTGLVLAAVLRERQRTIEALRGEAAARARLAPHSAAPGIAQRPAETLALADELRVALQRGELALHYQPVVDVDSRRLVGLEALMRWHSPRLGRVEPIQFIPVLEETAMILEAGRWALNRALLDQVSWVAMGLEPPRIAVNVSAVELHQPDFAESVIGALNGRTTIDFEITESRIMHDIDGNIEKLRRLRAMGVGVAIDDFGTGYSSLAYLARLPVRTLKIDRVFIARMLEDDDAMTLLQTIISLAQALHLLTVAEGVESEEQADVLGLLRCDRMQGYLVSEPLPPDQVAASLAKPAASR